MTLDRRQFLQVTASATAAALVGSKPSQAESQPTKTKRIRAIAFDGFVIFDPRAVAKRVEDVFPGKSAEFTKLWQTRQFEYSWLRTSGRQYADFWQVTADALKYTAESLKLSLSPGQRDRLMSVYRELPVWPDVPEALSELRRNGIRLRFLSNMTTAMLDANLAATKLGPYFEDHLSTDLVRFYKPSPRAYQMGIDHFYLKREEIAFAAFGAWDAAGAKWFGYPTVWVNRANAPAEELSVRADITTPSLKGLLELVGMR